MKQRDLEKCRLCGRGMMHRNDIVFYRIKLDTMGIQADAVRQMHGMEMMMGAAAPLAQIMGPDPDIAKPVVESPAFLICMPCMMDPANSLVRIIGD